MELTILVLSLSLLSLFLTLSLSLSLSKKKKPTLILPPGPPRLPVIGNLHQLGSLLHRDILHLSRRHGPLMLLKLGTVSTVVAASAAMAKEFMKTHDLDCCSRPVTTSTARLSYGCADIAFTPYGAKWRELRKICIIEFFSTKRVLMFRRIREDEVGRMVEGIAGRSVVNLSAVMISLSNDITCRLWRIQNFSKNL